MRKRRKQAKRSMVSRVSLAGVLAALCFAALLPISAQQPATAGNGSTPVPSVAANPAELPDSPSTTLARLEEGAGQNSASAYGTQQSPASTQSPQNQGQTPQQNAPPKPVGTATAEAPTTTGIAASQPAGVAIAPAKQHRVRTIVLRTGAIIGAAVAVGTVVALSEATPSKPPGAH